MVKMGKIYLSLLCLTLALTICNSQKVPFPDIKKLIENGFISKVEISGMPENDTTQVEEYYDVSDKITKVKILNGGHSETVILHTKYKQVAVIKNNTCDVETFGNAKEIVNPLFPNWLHATPNDKEVHYGPTSILRRAAENPPEYTNKATVRGIDCHSFEYEDPNRSGVRIAFFFTASWTTPFNVSKEVLMPVQIRLSGEGIPKEGSPNEPFIQYVDYVSFVPAVKDPTVFEVPYGIGCKGLKGDEIRMPAVPKRFSVSGEIFTDAAIMYIGTFKVWYDYIAKLGRIDVYSNQDKGVSKVLDYNTGVMYVTRDNEECEAVPIADNEFDEITDNLKLVMKDPESALGMKGDFYYLGKKAMRGILCDVWERVVENYTIDELTLNRIVYTYFISSHWWVIAVEGEVEEQVPVRLEISSYIEEQERAARTEINFFQFRKHPAIEYRQYSIINCASDASGRKYIGILMEVDVDAARKAEGNAPEFRTQAQNAIPLLAKISPIRLPYVRVDYEPGSITIMALILERAPAMAQFVEMGDDAPKTKEIKRGTVKTEELCAEECINTDACRGFHYCRNQGECFVSLLEWNEDWGEDVKGLQSCTAYKRQEAGSEFADVLLKDALTNLKNAIEGGKFIIEIRVGNDTVGYKATDLIDDASPVTSGDHDSDMFSRVVGQKKFKSAKDDQAVRSGGQVSTAGQCYRKCKSESNIACSSFSFCLDTNECLLSSVLALPNKDLGDSLESSPLCSIYSINYLQMFEEYNGRVRILPGKEAISADTASDCAKSCREKGEKECRGFDFCNSKKQCVFHKRHVLDLKDGESDLTNVGSGCSHYALKYSADFVEMGRYVLSDPNSKSVKAVSVENCAKMCSEDIELNCKSFDFCTSDNTQDTKCTLNTLSLEDDVKSDDSNTCQHYEKKDGLVDDYLNARQEKSREPTNTSGYTPGGLAGLIIGLLIFGMAVGIIGFLIYSYTRKRRYGDEHPVKFINE